MNNINKIKFITISLFVFIVLIFITNWISECLFNIVDKKLEFLTYGIGTMLFLVSCYEIIKPVPQKFSQEKCFSNKAIVYFYYRPSLFEVLLNVLAPYEIYYRNKLLVSLMWYNYYALSLSPGKKTFYVFKNRIDLNIQAGKSYFLKLTPKLLISRKLENIPSQKALSEINSCYKVIKK